MSTAISYLAEWQARNYYEQELYRRQQECNMQRMAQMQAPTPTSQIKFKTKLLNNPDDNLLLLLTKI
jgi:hypothetical protein